MKNIFLLVGILMLSITSCQKETDDLVESNAIQSNSIEKKSSEVENFRKAINEMNQPKYHPTKEYTEKYGSELSPERKQILLEPAKELIYSTGIDERALQNEANGDINIILNKAFEIYISQTSKK
ncbi:hypothetical protein [Avrilella dinanensis]|nr:hypothetical protein [Avrilella dinanensis]